MPSATCAPIVILLRGNSWNLAQHGIQVFRIFVPLLGEFFNPGHLRNQQRALEFGHPQIESAAIEWSIGLAPVAVVVKCVSSLH